MVSCLAGCASNSPNDPLEGMNRAVYRFNDGVDQALLKPVAEGYRKAVPETARRGVSNFFANLGEPLTALNNALQGKFEAALIDIARFGTNSIVGLAGVIDVATPLGMEKHNEDFGQTMGRWGFGAGPYLVLPVLGPSSLRDGGGLLVDMQFDPVSRSDHPPTRNSLTAARIVNTRANLLSTTALVDDVALDRYSFLRDAFLQRRRNLVYDGEPPESEDESGPTPIDIDDPVEESPAR